MEKINFKNLKRAATLASIKAIPFNAIVCSIRVKSDVERQCYRTYVGVDWDTPLFGPSRHSLFGVAIFESKHFPQKEIYGFKKWADAKEFVESYDRAREKLGLRHEDAVTYAKVRVSLFES